MRRPQNLKNEQGNMFVLTLFVLVLLSIMGLGLMTVTTNTLKNTRNEREDQAVYYIAEAGLIQKRAELSQQIKGIYNGLKNAYNKIEDPKKKVEFDFDNKFITAVSQIPINPDIPIEATYEDHFNDPTKSKVTVKRSGNDSVITFTIMSTGYIGENRSRTVTQAFDVSIENVKNTEDIDLGGNKPPSKLNACYTLFTHGNISSSGGGTFNGDIYSTEEITMPGSPRINGSIYSTENVNITGSPSQLNGVYSEKNIRISGGGEIQGNVQANGKVTITNLNNLNGNISAGDDVENVANVTGGIQTNGAFKMTNGSVVQSVEASKNATLSGGTIHQHILSGGEITVTNGTVNKDIFSNQNITINGGTLLGDIVSKKNIKVSDYPKFDSRGLHAIANNDIHITQWVTPTKTIYSGTLKFDQNVNYKSKPVSQQEAYSTIQQYEQNIINTINASSSGKHMDLSQLSNHVSIQNDCINSLPTLDAVDTVFTPAPPKQSNAANISIPSIYTGEYLVETSDDAHIDEIDLYPDSNYRINKLNITLNKPNGMLDVPKTRLQSNSTLTLNLMNNNTIYMDDLTTLPSSNLIIDLNGGDHTIYVDSLAIAGKIEFVNPGSLKIYVKNSLNLTNSSINMDGEASSLGIYFEGSKPFTLDGGSHVKSDLHVKNTDVTLTASGHLYGDVLVYGKNKITVNGGASAAEQLFLAPQSEFILGGGAVINGNIVVDKFTSSGGFTINAPTVKDETGNGGSTTLPVSDYGNADNLFERDPQLEINSKN